MYRLKIRNDSPIKPSGSYKERYQQDSSVDQFSIFYDIDLSSIEDISIPKDSYNVPKVFYKMYDCIFNKKTTKVVAVFKLELYDDDNIFHSKNGRKILSIDEKYNIKSADDLYRYVIYRNAIMERLMRYDLHYGAQWYSDILYAEHIEISKEKDVTKHINFIKFAYKHGIDKIVDIIEVL